MNTRIDPRGTPGGRAGPRLRCLRSARRAWRRFLGIGDRKFWLAVVAATALWGLTGACIKFISWNPLLIVGVTGAVAWVFLWGVHFRGAPLIRDPVERPEQLKAGVSYFVAKILYVVATRFLAVTTVAVFLHTSTIWVIVIAPFLLKRERVGWNGIIAVAIVVVGLGWILYDESVVGTNVLGLLAGAGAGLAYAFCIVYLRQQSRLSSSTESFLIGHMATAVLALLLLPFLAVTGNMEAPTLAPEAREVYCQSPLLMRYLPIVALFGAGLFTAIAGILFAYATKKVKALPTTLVSSLELGFTPLFAVPLMVGELSVANVGAAVLVLLAIACSEIFHGRKSRRRR